LPGFRSFRYPSKLLTVTYESMDARAQKDKVSALLKAAAGRL